MLRAPAGRGGSARVRDALAEGAAVRVRGPRNHFALRPAARYVFIAGGIGITPLLPMTAAAEAAGADWTLLYGGRARASMAFADHLTDRYGARVRLVPQDGHGLLDLAPYLGSPAAGTLVYCCGPEPLLRAAEEACRTWPDGAPRTERFQPRDDVGPEPGSGLLRVGAQPLRARLHRGAGAQCAAHGSGSGRAGSVLLRGGHVRDVRDGCHRRGGGPPRLRAHR